MTAVGRPPSCDCGTCSKCKNRVRNREWWRRQSPAKKREILDKRPPDLRKGRVCNPKLSPEQRRARWIIKNAIRDGRLERQPCEVCGNEKTDAHHDDYSLPLDVRWLCRKHHGEQHRKYHADQEAV